MKATKQGGTKTKWQIKVRSKTEIGWTHFSYLPTEFKDEFLKHTQHRGWTNNDWLDKWAKDDFGIKRIDTWEDLGALRRAIQNKYRDMYPELHILAEDSEIDSMGWTRVWLLDHMQKEIDKCLKK